LVIGEAVGFCHLYCSGKFPIDRLVSTFGIADITTTVHKVHIGEVIKRP